MPANRYALLIANDQYTHMATLNAPAKDVAALERVLRDPSIGNFADVTALVDDASPDNARAAYQAARKINSDTGVVQRATRLLNQLAGVPKFWE